MRTLKFTIALPLLALLFPVLAFAGSQSYTTPGTYTFTVPQYTGSLTVTLSGGGGGGEGGSGTCVSLGNGCSQADGASGQEGERSSFGSVDAQGGKGGGTGGPSNSGALGGDGGVSGSVVVDIPAMGCCTLESQANGDDGGNGYRVVKTYQAGAFAPGSSVTVTVGRGGEGGPGGPGSYWSDPNSAVPGTGSSDDGSTGWLSSGNDGRLPSGASGAQGQSGSVTITWNSAPPPPPPTGQLSCSVTFDQNPLTGANTTMRWTSTGADLFYINQVGWVGASGSAQVSQTGDYSGTVSGAGGTASCPATLSGPNSCNNSSLTCNPATGNLQNACGQTTTCPYGCSTVTNQCHTTCQQRRVCDATGTKVVNFCGGAVVKDCSRTGQICVAGQCISPPIEFESFDGTNVAGNTFRATGHLQVMPSLVKKGDTARVYWKVAHASSCTVLGSNGDGALGSGTGIWNMVFSGVTGKTTSAIMAKTTYTLLCRSLEGASPPTVQETATVNVLPSFQEL